jgi:hypothetical protein
LLEGVSRSLGEWCDRTLVLGVGATGRHHEAAERHAAAPVGVSLPAEALTVSPAPATIHFAHRGAVSHKAPDLNGDEKPEGSQLDEVPRVRCFPTGGDRMPSWRVLRCASFG